MSHDIHHCNCAEHCAVRIRDLGVRIGSVTILENVTATVPRGVCTAIVGPNGIITGCSVTTCGNAVDSKICSYVADNYRLRISPSRAEELRVKIGSFFDNQLISADVMGRNLVDNMPHQAEITGNEIYPMMHDVAMNLADVIENISLMCPEKLVMDVYRSGITLCGGFANSYGIGDFLSDRLKICVNVPKAPEDAVALGALRFFDDRDKMFKML